MNKKLFLILFLIPLLALGVNAFSSQQASFIDPLQMDYNEQISYDYNQFFSGWTEATVTFPHPTEPQSVYLTTTKGGSDVSFISDELNVWLTAFSDTVFVSFQSKETDYTGSVEMRVWEGTASSGDTWELQISGTVSTPSGDPPSQIQGFSSNYDIYTQDSSSSNNFVYFEMDDYFSNYDSISVTFPDEINQQSIYLESSIGEGEFYTFDNAEVDVILRGDVGNTVILDIQSVNMELIKQFTVSAINTDGSTSDSFNVIINSDVTEEEEEEPTPPSEGLDIDLLNQAVVSYYKLDENSGTVAGDSVTSNTKNLENGLGWGNGIINSGLSFTGSGEYIDIHTFNVGNNDLSVSVWFKLNDLEQRGIMSSWDNNEGYNGIFLAVSNGNIQAKAGGDGTGGGQMILESNPQINTWYNYVLTYDSSTNTARHYLNSNFVDSQIQQLDSHDHPLRLGRFYPLFTARYFDGFIDEVGIYDRALTSDEVSFLYAEGSPDADQQYEFVSLQPPTQTSSFVSPLNLNYDQSVSYNLANFFEDYDSVQLQFTDPITTETVTLNQDFSTPAPENYLYETDHLRVELVPVGDIRLDIQSFTTSLETTMELTLTNEGGSITDSFILNIDDEAEPTFNPPTQTQSPASLELITGSTYQITFGDFFSNFNDYEIDVVSANDSFTLGRGEFVSLTTGTYMELENFPSTLFFINNNDIEESISLTLRAYNDYGSVESETYTITYSPEGLDPTTPTTEVEVPNWFPSPPEGQEGFWALTVIIGLVVLVSLSSPQESMLSKLSFGTFAGMGAFILFAYIGWIPIWMVVMLVILTVGISVIMIKSAMSG